MISCQEVLFLFNAMFGKKFKFPKNVTQDFYSLLIFLIQTSKNFCKSHIIRHRFVSSGHWIFRDVSIISIIAFKKTTYWTSLIWLLKTQRFILKIYLNFLSSINVKVKRALGSVFSLSIFSKNKNRKISILHLFNHVLNRYMLLIKSIFELWKSIKMNLISKLIKLHFSIAKVLCNRIN